MPNAARLKISLSGIDTSPWRLIDVPLSMNLTGLHRTIQAAFLWHDSHLWEFQIGQKRYGPMWVDSGRDAVFNPDNKRLTSLTRSPVNAFSYVYDFGDWWEHQVEVLELMDVASGDRLPKFVEGAYRTPPENIGGPLGFAHFLACIRDPKHPEHAEMMEWYGKNFDTDDIEEDILKIVLRREASMRPPMT